MSTNVLVPVDGSDRSWEGFEYAVELFDDADITVLYVVDPAEGDYYIDEEEDDPVERSTKIRERVETYLADGDDRQIEVNIETGKPAETIVNYTEDSDVDHVVISSRGRSGVRRLLLGSVAETVVRRAAVPVTVVRE